MHFGSQIENKNENTEFTHTSSPQKLTSDILTRWCSSFCWSSLLTTPSFGSVEISLSTSGTDSCAVENQYTCLAAILQFVAVCIVTSLLDTDAVFEARLSARGSVRPRRRETPSLSNVALDEETTTMATKDNFLCLAKDRFRISVERNKYPRVVLACNWILGFREIQQFQLSFRQTRLFRRPTAATIQGIFTVMMWVLFILLPQMAKAG